VPVTICRLSGKLPTDGCRSAVVFDGDGNPTDRSMLYTEYFVRGTEPTDYCPLHRDFGHGRNRWRFGDRTRGDSDRGNRDTARGRGSPARPVGAEGGLAC
jgi:hypothetical protein